MNAITTDRMESAIALLSDTDVRCAELKSDMERAQWKAKRMEAAVFLRLDGTVASREANAKTHPEVEAAWELYFSLLKEYEACRNHRTTETIVVDAWRSVNSGMRRGNV